MYANRFPVPFFQLLKGRIADHVFHPASLLFRRFLIDASSYKLFRKELVSLIDFFSNFLACLGQMQKIIAVYCQKAALLQNGYGSADAGFETSMCRARSIERTIPFFLLQH